MGKSLRDFAKKIRKYGANVEFYSNKEVRQLGILVQQTLITSTPVDTGRARNNWIATLGTPSSEIKEASKYERNARSTISSNTAEIEKRQPEQSIYISNNLPYIKRLNDGYSAQAPAGFVEAALVRAQNAIKKIRLLRGT
jgi:hypothetical protein